MERLFLCGILGKTPGMKWTWSAYGERFSEPSGILKLMRDLGEAMASGDEDLCMLGGGNPAVIPEVVACFQQRWMEVGSDPGHLAAVLGKYDTAQGAPRFLDAMAAHLNDRFGWELTRENLVVTQGSQMACYHLFHLLAGPGKRILLPLSPEYIGYADQGHEPGLFRAAPGRMAMTGPHRFKYLLDPDALAPGDDIAAMAVSRPTNPTGNVLTDAEMQTLSDLAAAREIPLIIDNAYGEPFPGIVFRDIQPAWAPHHILLMSLSKLGLPGTRTGIVVAAPEVIRHLTALNAVSGLANGNIGQALVAPMLGAGTLEALCREVIRPYYATRSQRAAALWEAALGDTVPWMRHEAEGTMFHWLRFPELPVSTQELYEKLKARGVLVIPGHSFFYGLDQPAQEQYECIRVHTAMDTGQLERGIALIAETVKSLY